MNDPEREVSLGESEYFVDPDRRRKYFGDFAASHISIMKLLVRGGILGRENQDWRNISEHCLVEAVGADILAESLGADRKKLVAAAIIHDWFKRHEIEAMREIGGGHGYEKTTEEDEEMLQQMGVDEDLIHLAHSNIPERADKEYLESRTLEEKIMHYIDIITFNTSFIDFHERQRRSAEKQANVEFSEHFRDQYGGPSLYEVQLVAAETEQEEIENALGLEKGKLVDYILAQLKNRIDTYKAKTPE